MKIFEIFDNFHLFISPKRNYCYFSDLQSTLANTLMQFSKKSESKKFDKNHWILPTLDPLDQTSQNVECGPILNSSSLKNARLMLPNEDADPCRIVSILSFSCRTGFLFSRRLRDFTEVIQRHKLYMLRKFKNKEFVRVWKHNDYTANACKISLLQRVMQSVKNPWQR